MIYPNYISGNEASQIAEEDSLKEEWMGAKSWFEGVIESREEFELENMPKYSRFICHMDYVDSDLYYDYGADYYFAVLNSLKNENKKYNNTNNMKRRIRLTESDLHRIIKESVNQILNEISYKTAHKASEEALYKSQNFHKNGDSKNGWKKYQQSVRLGNEAHNRYKDEYMKGKSIEDLNKETDDNWKELYKKHEPEYYKQRYEEK